LEYGYQKSMRSSFAAIILTFTLDLGVTPGIDVTLPSPSNLPTF
jgi:hypothetical protein